HFSRSRRPRIHCFQLEQQVERMVLIPTIPAIDPATDRPSRADCRSLVARVPAALYSPAAGRSQAARLVAVPLRTPRPRRPPPRRLEFDIFRESARSGGRGHRTAHATRARQSIAHLTGGKGLCESNLGDSFSRDRGWWLRGHGYSL